MTPPDPAALEAGRLDALSGATDRAMAHLGGCPLKDVERFQREVEWVLHALRDEMRARDAAALHDGDRVEILEPYDVAYPTFSVRTATLKRVSPAKSAEASYVPKVGDVVTFSTGKPDYVVVKIAGPNEVIGDALKGEGRQHLFPKFGLIENGDLRYVRPATPAERIAAGIDKVEGEECPGKGEMHYVQGETKTAYAGRECDKCREPKIEEAGPPVTARCPTCGSEWIEYGQCGAAYHDKPATDGGKGVP